MFIIEDEIHAEQKGEFSTSESALIELQRLSKIPYDEKPNQCPCTNWKNCERHYQIIEYDDSTIPWKELNRQDILKISKNGIKWEI